MIRLLYFIILLVSQYSCKQKPIIQVEYSNYKFKVQDSNYFFSNLIYQKYIGNNCMEDFRFDVDLKPRSIFLYDSALCEKSIFCDESIDSFWLIRYGNLSGSLSSNGKKNEHMSISFTHYDFDPDSSYIFEAVSRKDMFNW